MGAGAPANVSLPDTAETIHISSLALIKVRLLPHNALSRPLSHFARIYDCLIYLTVTNSYF